MPDRHTVHRVCPFCEATCGLSITVEDDQIQSVRGDPDDPFSRGFLCPKAVGLKELHHDPDRLTKPMRRTADGWQEISWAEAYEEVGTRLREIRERYGNDAIGTYTGNPVVHDLGALVYRPALQRALASKSLFNSSAIDTLPKIVATGLMFGRHFPLAVPVPDIDRTDHLLIIGANPAISHGSLMTMPDAPGRLKAVVARGGVVIVVDPRRTETAKLASEHHFIRPGGDAAFLLAIVHTLFDEDLVTLGEASGLVNGLDEVRALAREFAPEAVADFCGIPAAVIRRLAREHAAAKSAACYGRLGTCVQEFGTLASWGVDLLNILTGNLDRVGGAMFTTPAAPLEAALPKESFEMGRWHSRVSGQPEVEGLIPSSTMAEEMLTPGDGQVRAMILLMTNPLRSAANSAQLERAFAGLDYLVAIDFYINETTRHAHLILPTPAPSEQAGYELGLYLLSVRNVAKWSSPVVPPEPDRPETWQVFSAIAARLLGLGHLSEQAVDDFVFRQLAGQAVANTRWEGLDVEEVFAKVDGGIGPARIVDLLLRVGPHGDGFGRRQGGLTLARLKQVPHGIDLGPLEPDRLAQVIGTASGAIELTPSVVTRDLARLRARIAQRSGEMVLIGRRAMRWSNSFMHNLPALVKGRSDRCTLQVCAVDADAIGLVHGGSARVTSRVGSIVAPVEITDDVMPGVVSLPHGWGHDDPASRLRVANAHPGVNANVLTDDRAYDEASGTAVLFGTPVRVEPSA